MRIYRVPLVGQHKHIWQLCAAGCCQEAESGFRVYKPLNPNSKPCFVMAAYSTAASFEDDELAGLQLYTFASCLHLRMMNWQAYSCTHLQAAYT